VPRSIRFSTAHSATDDAPAPVAFGPVSVLALAAGQSSQTSVAVPPSSSATMSLFSVQPISATLIDPQGQPVVTTATTMTYTSTTQPDGTTLTSYALSNPLPGAWTVMMTNTSATSSTVGTLMRSFDTPLSLNGGAPSVIAPGATLPLTASLFTGSTPLDGAVITASVLISGAAPLQTTLLGLGNGVYSGSVTIPVTATGIASVVFEASGTTNGAPYDLTTDASSQVSSGQATIGASIDERAVVTEGDSLYSALLITPTVTIPQTGTYEFSGQLVDPAGNLVASAASALTLTAGMPVSASLSFDGRAIYNSGHDGPYTLQKLSLYHVDSGAPLITPQEPYTTAAYQASQFEHPALTIAPAASSAAADPNTNGLFQDLAVTATLQASQPGAYTVSAVLVDPAQAVITVTAESALLGTTPQIVRLNFPSQAIADHGVDGPYRVIGFTVRGADGHILALVDSLVTTDAYSATQFAPSTAMIPSETPTATITSVPTATTTTTTAPTGTATATSTATNTSVPTATPTSTSTVATTTLTVAPTTTSVPTAMAISTGTPAATSTSTGATTATSTAMATPTPTAIPTSTSTSTSTATGTTSPTDTAAPTAQNTSVTPPTPTFTVVPPTPTNSVGVPPAPANPTVPATSIPASTAPSVIGLSPTIGPVRATSTPGQKTKLPPSAPVTDTPEAMTVATPISIAKSSGTTPTVNLSVVGNTVTKNSVITVSAQLWPNIAASINAKLATTLTSAHTVVAYVRAPLPHVSGGKRLPPCRKGVEGCVAKRVVRRISKTVVLYQTTVRARADRRGHLTARIRLGYVARTVMQATLIVTVKAPRGTFVRSIHVRIVPPPPTRRPGRHTTHVAHRKTTPRR